MAVPLVFILSSLALIVGGLFFYRTPQGKKMFSRLCKFVENHITMATVVDTLSEALEVFNNRYQSALQNNSKREIEPLRSKINQINSYYDIINAAVGENATTRAQDALDAIVAILSAEDIIISDPVTPPLGIGILVAVNNILVPTDAAGGNPDYTNAFSDINIFLGATDNTSSWTFTVQTQTNVTATITTPVNRVVISSLTADEGSVVVRASRTSYSDIDITVPVKRLKQGETGPSGVTVDDETIEVDGGGDLKVKNHTFYNTGGFTNVLGIVGSTSGDGAGTTDTFFLTNTNIDIRNSTNSIIIGDDLSVGSTFSASNYPLNKVYGFGNGITLNRSNAALTTIEKLIVNLLPDTDSNSAKAISNAFINGFSPVSVIEKSWCLGFDRTIFPAIGDLDHNTYYIAQSRTSSSGTNQAVIEVNLTDSDIGTPFFARIEVSIIGFDSVSTATDVYINSDVVTLVNGSIVATDNFPNQKYESGDLVGATHAYSNPSDVFTVTVTPPGGASDVYGWIVNYKMHILA